MAEQEKKQPAVAEAELPAVQPDEANFEAPRLYRMIWITVVLLAVISVGLVVLTQWQMQQNAEVAAATARYPLREETEAHARQLLEGYGVVDAEQGVYRVPIDRAMEEIVEAYGGDSVWTLPQPSAVSRRM
ncbi:hypothetical protein [Rhodothermus marinus]|uniref:Uncharacterized protein n=1 Tax=Rhodothermus marinus (strain ATCC 43812 / DSM 4252 / R-10) TaxID=518766 RepID=D0MDE0_RHOM4|nr:hypothetical protein [Rhodothermus marinus]ACY47133.1 hypothetical protein Rmar_0227 [Rhodothermus marinus DSM 4252]AEN72158.1 hypothetical protein Rhom172_0210 [Rhodothermus marinus SG0.5JP17-172]